MKSRSSTAFSVAAVIVAVFLSALQAGNTMEPALAQTVKPVSPVWRQAAGNAWSLEKKKITLSLQGQNISRKQFYRNIHSAGRNEI